jgi:hypothetical protein
MASSSELEKLERRYAENPEGRFFAPLADAYRKSGQVDRALELVRSGIQKHPDYLSAHIVLGRCLLDKHNDAEAGQTFQAVLGLDAENIIALKSLAEIAERGGRTDEAREWLGKLLIVDSMNSEAEADLQRLGGPIAAPAPPVEAAAAEAAPETSFADVAAEMEPVAAAAEPEPPSPTPGPSATELEEIAAAATQPMEALPLELPPEPPIEPVREVPEPIAIKPDIHPLPEVPSPGTETPLEVMAFDDSLSWGTGERSSRAIRAEDIEAVVHDAAVQTPAIEFMAEIEPAAASEPAPPAAGPSLDGFSLESPPDQSFAGVAAAPAEPVNVDLPANLSGAYSIVADVFETPTPSPQIPSDLPLIMPEDVTPPEEMKRPSAKMVQMVSPPPREEPAAAAQPMVTETMGDLYLKQGFRSEAADVYRRLLSHRPGDASLAAKLRALEGPPPDLSAAALGSESVGTWLKRVAGSRIGSPPPDAPTTHNPQPTTDSQSPLETAFASPVEVAGEPAHPAQDTFSLDQIFGSAPEAAPRPSAAATELPPPPTGASFDEFFGQPPETGGARPAGNVPPSLPGRPPEGGEEDLSAFSAWLQGLKK